MAKVEWTEDLSVSHPKLDEQHQKYIHTFENLIQAMRDGRDSIELIGTLKDILEYLKNHFSLEEEIMAECSYPDIEEHIEEHRKFSNNASEMMSRYLSGQDLPSEEVLVYLRDWFISHIEGTDQKYVPYLNTSK